MPVSDVLVAWLLASRALSHSHFRVPATASVNFPNILIGSIFQFFNSFNKVAGFMLERGNHGTQFVN